MGMGQDLSKTAAGIIGFVQWEMGFSENLRKWEQSEWLRNISFCSEYYIARQLVSLSQVPTNLIKRQSHCIGFKKYKTFSVLIYSYINTSGNWKNEKLCGNTTPAGRSVFTQFRVFPIFTRVDITVYQYGKNVLYFFYNIAQRTLTEEWREIFRVDIELYQHGS